MGAHFLSHTNQTWRICYLLGDVQIMLLSLLEISNCFKSWKKCWSLHFQVFRASWHKRSDTYSSLLSKPQLFSMACRTFKMLLPTWQSGFKQILIGGFQKGRTCPCISRDTKVSGCQTFFIFLFMYHIVI